MKVLLLPVNIASDISHKVRALRSIGVDAAGFSIVGSTIQSADDIKILAIDKGNAVTRRLRRASAVAEMWRMISRADILHWVSDANFFSRGLNERFLRRADKPGVVQWTGSDIRIPERDFAVNEYYGRAFREGGYEYGTESSDVSRSNQAFAAGLDFLPLEFIGMGHYIDDALFPKRFRTWQCVALSEHTPNYPSLANTRPLVVHSPSAPVAKGTPYVLEAVRELKAKYDFEFTLVENTQRGEALKIMSECDVYVDQLVLGAHGFAAVEAMAFGKPVICYVNPEIGKDYPADLPIVNANPDNIAEQLEALIRNASLRREIGEKSRAYVEKYHDERKVAAELVQIYDEVIERHHERRRRK
jgi:glycosyltransferase involved in cell wall biosynthesis